MTKQNKFSKEQQEVEKHSRPLWITDKFVDNTKCMMGTTCGIYLIALIITMAFGLFELSKEEGREYLIWGDERVKVFDMWVVMQDKFQDDQKKHMTIPERSIEQQDYTTFFIFECEGCDDAFTVENLKIMNTIEQNIMNHSEYKNFCLASTESTECDNDEALISITKEIENINELTDSKLSELKQRLFNDEDMFTNYKSLFHKNFKQNNPKSKIFRSMMKFGSPLLIDGKLKGEDDKEQEDFNKKQHDKFTKFTEDVLMKISRDQKEPKNIRIIEYSSIISEIETGSLITQDFVWIIGSILFVQIYMTFHLKSIFLSSMAMVNIVMSFPLTLIVFRGLQITYFSFLHILAIFIVLGIAADDVFVYIDAWRQSQHVSQISGDYNRRMAYTFRRAAKAMLATSSTTAACFFATGLSEIMPLSSFGIFAGILIPMNFILVILAFPTFIMFYEYHLKKLCGCLNKSDSYETEQESKVEKFFQKKWNHFIFKGRYFIMIFFAIWFGISAWQASTIEPIKEEEKYYPDSLETVHAQNLVSNDFHKSSAEKSVTLNVYYFFGVKDIDNSGIGMWESDKRGKIKWDDNFDLSPQESQQWLYDFCINTKENELVLDEQVECFIVEFKEFVEQEKQLTFPVQQEEFFPIVKEFIETPVGAYHLHTRKIGIIENQLKFTQIFITAKGKSSGGYDVIKPQYDAWEDFRKESQNSAPQGLKIQKQTALGPWIWMPSERAFVKNAIQGIIISIAFSFAVLLATSLNVIVSIYSVFSIIGVILSVMTVIVLNGWELGVSESVALVIVIGLSVDYVVHLANHYIESVAQPTRYYKVQVSLKEIGISIISGAITTIGSGLFLMFAINLLFNKFSILILATISFSVIYSLIFFTALLHIGGPTGHTGSLKYIYYKIKGIQPEDYDETTQEHSVDLENKNNESSSEMLAKKQQSQKQFYESKIPQKKITLEDGSVYNGGWLDGKKEGRGEITYCNGSYYYGQFSQDKINGQGLYIWPDGKHYTGTWKDGQRSGQGTTTWPDGTNYQGSYLNNQKHGFGQFTIVSKQKTYEGYWKHGKQHDYCKIKQSNGSYVIFKYFNGQIIND